jgi:hypothetical protein
MVADRERPYREWSRRGVLIANTDRKAAASDDAALRDSYVCSAVVERDDDAYPAYVIDRVA